MPAFGFHDDRIDVLAFLCSLRLGPYGASSQAKLEASRPRARGPPVLAFDVVTPEHRAGRAVWGLQRRSLTTHGGSKGRRGLPCLKREKVFG